MFGHPLHPAVVHFPLGLLLSATGADVLWLLALTSDTHVGAIMMAAGLLAALVAMGAGMLDLAKLDAAVVPHAMQHMAAVGTAWVGYGIALYLRKDALLAGAQLAWPTVAISIASAIV